MRTVCGATAGLPLNDDVIAAAVTWHLLCAYDDHSCKACHMSRSGPISVTVAMMTQQEYVLKLVERYQQGCSVMYS